MHSIKLRNRMDTMYVNPRNSKTFDPHRLLFNLSDKVKLKGSAKCVVLSNLVFTIHEIIRKVIQK